MSDEEDLMRYKKIIADIDRKLQQQPAEIIEKRLQKDRKFIRTGIKYLELSDAAKYMRAMYNYLYDGSKPNFVSRKAKHITPRHLARFKTFKTFDINYEQIAQAEAELSGHNPHRSTIRHSVQVVKDNIEVYQ